MIQYGSMEFSERGIPILPLSEKIAALQECISNGSDEDAMEHLFDLMAKVQPTIPGEVGGDREGEPWGREALIKLFETYGANPTEIKDDVDVSS